MAHARIEASPDQQEKMKQIWQDVATAAVASRMTAGHSAFAKNATKRSPH